MAKVLNVGVILFENFELLDVFGPLEMLGMYPETFSLHMLGQHAGAVRSAQGPRVALDSTFDQVGQYQILLVPGGAGTRIEVSNQALLNWLSNQAENAQYVMSVCTGSALLAASGLLEGRRATTNKNAFQWVTGFGHRVTWIKQARWVVDGNYFTSSGVSAGIDMSLGLIEEIMDRSSAEQAAIWAEYQWNRDPSNDPFASIAGLVE
ncbi:MAG: DJ-1/PfpI family protein [Arenicellales bacterium]